MTNDILGLIHEDEASFPFELMGKKDGKYVDTGVVWNVRDLGNKDSQLALKRERDKSLGERMRTKTAIEDEQLGRMISMASSDPTDEMLAHCVTNWEWGEKTLGKYSVEFSYDNVLAIIKGEPWIKAQVLSKVLDISGFMKA